MNPIPASPRAVPTVQWLHTADPLPVLQYPHSSFHECKGLEQQVSMYVILLSWLFSLPGDSVKAVPFPLKATFNMTSAAWMLFKLELSMLPYGMDFVFPLPTPSSLTPLCLELLTHPLNPGQRTLLTAPFTKPSSTTGPFLSSGSYEHIPTFTRKSQNHKIN